MRRNTNIIFFKQVAEEQLADGVQPQAFGALALVAPEGVMPSDPEAYSAAMQDRIKFMAGRISTMTEVQELDMTCKEAA